MIRFSRLHYQLVCFYQNDPTFVHEFYWKYDLRYTDLDIFTELCEKYENELGQRKWNMRELVDHLMKDTNLKPFFILYYDKRMNVEKEGPWVTQVIFTWDKFKKGNEDKDSNMFIRVSYDDYKFGLFRYYPFETTKEGKLIFIRDRINEVYKYSDGLYIPASSNPNHWREKTICQEMVEQAHYRLEKLVLRANQKNIIYKVNYLKNLKVFFNPVVAADVKVNKYYEDDCLYEQESRIGHQVPIETEY